MVEPKDRDGPAVLGDVLYHGDEAVAQDFENSRDDDSIIVRSDDTGVATSVPHLQRVLDEGFVEFDSSYEGEMDGDDMLLRPAKGGVVRIEDAEEAVAEMRERSA